MTKISAQIILDSKTEFSRITTMMITFPRYILAELNTHRMLSKNSASSRAIPFKKLLESVENNPFIPIAWQKDHKGMQGTEYITDLIDIKVCQSVWLEARNNAIKQAKRLAGVDPQGSIPVTKQLCNRLIEPYMWHTVLITATEWENFFALRCPKYKLHSNFSKEDGKPVWEETFRSKKDFINTLKPTNINGKPIKEMSEVDWLKINKGQADIHMMALAEAMWDAYNESTPKELKAGEWHIPFSVDAREENEIKQFADLVRNNLVKDGWEAQLKIATARCARTSYTVVGEESKQHDYKADIELHDKLALSGHWSPFEHCAKAMNEEEYPKHIRTEKGDNNGCSEKSGFMYDSMFINDKDLGWSGNFKGFIQYRKLFANENITK